MDRFRKLKAWKFKAFEISRLWKFKAMEFQSNGNPKYDDGNSKPWIFKAIEIQSRGNSSARDSSREHELDFRLLERRQIHLVGHMREVPGAHAGGERAKGVAGGSDSTRPWGTRSSQ
jgi:hypothetical protein